MANYNKKKRKGLAAILVMAIVIVLGGGTAFAYPYLETAYSPKAQVLAALQTAGEESKQGMQTMISEVSDLLTGQTQLTGNVTFTRAELDGKDYYFDEEGKYDSTKVRPMVALTYDDGPGQYTEKLLQCLQENNAKATFFMLGENAEKYPDIVKELKDAGMELGNHTYDHQILTSLSQDQISSEISKANEAIQNGAGVPADTLRPPGGSCNETVQQLANMPIIKWSLDTKDWKTKSADKTYQKVMDNVQDGSVVLMHDIHEWSVEASLRMIPELVEKGYKLVTVQELAEAKGITLENGKVYYYFGEGTQQVE